MKVRVVVAVVLLGACGDPTGPDLGRLHDAYVLERVGFDAVPAQLEDWGGAFGLFMVGGGVRCPDSASGSPEQEVYELVAVHPEFTAEATVRFEFVCETDPPNRLRFTYPATGETIVGTVWEGMGAEKERFFLTKRLPSPETFAAAIAALDLPEYFLLRAAAPKVTFRRSR